MAPRVLPKLAPLAWIGIGMILSYAVSFTQLSAMQLVVLFGCCIFAAFVKAWYLEREHPQVALQKAIAHGAITGLIALILTF